MRRLLLAAIGFLLASTLWATPAKMVRRNIIVCGREVAATFVGDEWLHYWRTDDGRAFVEEADGSFSELDPTEFKYPPKSRTTQTRALPGPVKEPIVGERRGLVILVNTPDIKFSCAENPAAAISAMMNEEGYHEGTAKGSVRDYFLAQSYGQLDYHFDVVGPVTVANEMAYYGDNRRFTYEACCVGEMLQEALLLIDDEVDFTVYDLDGDGAVENVYMIYAGHAETTSEPGLIWPHAYNLSDINRFNKKVNAVTLDGVKIDNYACSSEYRDEKNSKLDGIGSFCHEFSHCLGLPDLYNVNNPSNYTIGRWSVMDTGCYNDDGDTPPSYTAYERWFCGWIKLEELRTDTTVTALGGLDTSGKAFVYYNEATRNEYYIVQNTRKEGWNKFLLGQGLAVFHVDEKASEWVWNSVNCTPSHLRFDIFCADNKKSYSSEGGDLYPHKNGNNSLTDTSKPAATVFNRNVDGTTSMGKFLTGITEHADGTISFDFSLSGSLREALGLGVDEIKKEPAGEEVLRYNVFGQQVKGNYRGIIVTRDGRKIISSPAD